MMLSKFEKELGLKSDLLTENYMKLVDTIQNIIGLSAHYLPKFGSLTITTQAIVLKISLKTSLLALF